LEAEIEEASEEDIQDLSIEETSGWNATDRWTTMLREQEQEHKINGKPKVTMP
jgi:hypothetical protein